MKKDLILRSITESVDGLLRLERYLKFPDRGEMIKLRPTPDWRVETIDSLSTAKDQIESVIRSLDHMINTKPFEGGD